MKTIIRNSVLGLVAILALVWVSIPNQAQAIALCSSLGTPTMQITLPGYGTFANSTGNLDATYSISVPSGTAITGTYSNFSGAADNYTIFDRWPGGGSQTYHSNPGSRTHASGAITSSTFFSIALDPNCTEDPSPAEGGSVTVNVTVTAPAPTATLTASPNPVNSGSPTTLTWTSTNATSCAATGGAGFSTGNAISGSDASSNLTAQTVFSMTCTGAGGTVTKSVTVGVNAAPGLACSPSLPSVFTNETVVFSATGGSGGTSPYYTWNTGGGGTSCLAGTPCSASYTTTGVKTITVTRNGVSATCSVTVNQAPIETPAKAAFTGSNPATCTVSGWGYDPEEPSPQTIKIYSDGVLAETVSAGGAGCVGSACTFSANLSWNISAGIPHTITGKILDSQGNWVPFTDPQTSLSLTCPADVVQCSGAPDEGTTATNYTFNASGGSSYTWSISPTTGITPGGASGSGASVQKAFTTTGARTVTFTSGGQSGSCSINILSAPPGLSYNIKANGSDGPITVAYGALPTLSWTSSGADRVDNFGSTPTDEAWNGTQPTDFSGSVQVSPLVRTTYRGRGVRYSPIASASDSVIVRVQPQCLPAGQTATVNQPVSDSLEAAGGDGTYAWTATGATPASGTGATFVPTYSTAGTKTVTLTSDSLSTTCTVTVSAAPVTTGTVIVNSVNADGEPFLATWSLSGPSGGSQTQGTPSATATYASSPVGLYTLSAMPVEEYTSAITPGAGQTLAAGGTITYTITYTPVPPAPGVPWVDLTANPSKVAVGDSSMLSWTSDGIEPGTCVASGDWAKSKDDEGSESTGELTQDTTYTITCDEPASEKGAPGTVSDTVNVSVVTISDDDDDDPDCSDGVNNDAGDELIDYPADPGCYGDEDPSEEDVPPGDDDDVIITACDDGFDNDGDGTVDGADVGCNSGDGTEQDEPDIREI